MSKSLLLKSFFYFVSICIIPVQLYASSANDSTIVFRNPVDHPIQLTGTFGELRTNHFHTGIDIRSSRGVIGDEVYTIGRGHISRIKIQSGGYGKVLYIDHPNGYTSVYAHLNEFKEEVEDFVREYQYTNQQFEVDIYLDPRQFPLKKDAVIGEMGMTGRAYGPHLHFEIRQTKSEIPVNPLIFDLFAKDSRKPQFDMLHFYVKDEIGKTNHFLSKSLRITNSQYRLAENDTLSVSYAEFALGLGVIDRFDGLSSRNGIFRLWLEVDSTILFDVKFDQISFAEYRFSNAYLDYASGLKKRPYISRLHRLPGVHLNVFKTLKNDGYIKLEPGVTKQITIKASDYLGNSQSLRFWIKSTELALVDSIKSDNAIFAYHDRDNFFADKDIKLWIPECALPENQNLLIAKTVDLNAQNSTHYYHIHHPEQALLKDLRLSLNISHIPKEYRQKACLILCDGKNDDQSYGGTIVDQTLSADIKSFGTYKVIIDSIAPEIKPIRWSANWKNRTRISFKITDNLIASGNANELIYDAYLNNEWILFQYDKKNDLIEYQFDKKLTRGTHDLMLLVKDDRGNTKIFEAEVKY